MIKSSEKITKFERSLFDFKKAVLSSLLKYSKYSSSKDVKNAFELYMKWVNVKLTDDEFSATRSIIDTFENENGENKPSQDGMSETKEGCLETLLFSLQLALKYYGFKSSKEIIVYADLFFDLITDFGEEYVNPYYASKTIRQKEYHYSEDSKDDVSDVTNTAVREYVRKIIQNEY